MTTINEKYSNRDLRGIDLKSLPPEEFNGMKIIGSIFNIGPDEGAFTFKGENGNFERVFSFLPEGIKDVEVENCTFYQEG